MGTKSGVLSRKERIRYELAATEMISLCPNIVWLMRHRGIGGNGLSIHIEHTAGAVQRKSHMGPNIRWQCPIPLKHLQISSRIDIAPQDVVA